MNRDIDIWHQELGEIALRAIGIKEHYCVLDFGCGPGNYTIPIAKIVGEAGIVYALDKDADALNQLMEKANELGLTNIQRIFNLRRGLKPEDTFDIGPRFMEEAKVGPSKGHSIKPILKDLVREYYIEMGWDEVTGVPKRETLIRLDLVEYLDDLEKLQELYSLKKSRINNFKK